MVARSFLLVLSLAALILPDTGDAARLCTPAKVPGRYPGLSVLRDSNSTEAKCQAICANDDSCVDYLLEGFKSQFSCFTFTIIQAGKPPSTMSVYPHSGRCGTNLPTTKGDFPGNDLSNIPSPNVVQCSYTCEETSACNAYSWTNYNGGTCWMKTAKSELKGPFGG